MTLKQVTESDTPEGTLKEVLANIDQIECVMVLAIKRDGTQLLNTSRMNTYEKSFLVAFANSWLARWFNG